MGKAIRHDNEPLGTFTLEFDCGHSYKVFMPMPAIWSVDINRGCPLCDPVNKIRCDMRDPQVVPLEDVLCNMKSGGSLNKRSKNNGSQNGPLRRIEQVINYGGSPFSRDTVILECGHRGQATTGAVRARCRVCRLEAEKEVFEVEG